MSASSSSGPAAHLRTASTRDLGLLVESMLEVAQACRRIWRLDEAAAWTARADRLLDLVEGSSGGLVLLDETACGSWDLVRIDRLPRRLPATLCPPSCRCWGVPLLAESTREQRELRWADSPPTSRRL